jgi:hypothetical protein
MAPGVDRAPTLPTATWYKLDNRLNQMKRLEAIILYQNPFLCFLFYFCHNYEKRNFEVHMVTVARAIALNFYFDG